MPETSINERIRYVDAGGRNWFGTLTRTDGLEGRSFSFELESESGDLPFDCGSTFATEIETKPWLDLQGEGGRHLQLRKPVVTYTPFIGGWDLHGFVPITLRGIGHDLAESRFPFAPDEAAITAISFSPEVALHLIADRWYVSEGEDRLSPRPNTTHCQTVSGLGSVEIQLRTSGPRDRLQATLRGTCLITLRTEKPVRLSDAPQILRWFTLFLDFLYGKPMPCPMATLTTEQGNISLQLSGVSHAARGKEDWTASAIPVSLDGLPEHKGIDKSAFFNAMEVFWRERDRLTQPMFVALTALHSDHDMLYRFFLTIPTLEALLPKPDLTEENERILKTKEAFFRYVEANAEAKDFCRRFMKLLDSGKKEPTLAMKLDPVIAWLGDEGWKVPKGSSQKIRDLRDPLAHSAKLKITNADELWPLLATVVTVLVGQVLRELGIPLAAVQTHRASNFRAIGQLPKD